MKGKYLFAIVAMALAVYSCGKIGEGEIEEDKTPTLETLLYPDLQVGTETPIDGKNLIGLEWTATNSYIASINGDKIVPKHVGFTRMKCDLPGFLLTLQVKPKYNDYDLPIVYLPINSRIISGDKDYYFIEENEMIWNAAPTTVYLHEHAINPSRTREAKSNNTLQVFKTNNVKSPLVAYFFTNQKLTMSGAIIDPAYLSNLPQFLYERYEVFSVDVNKYSAYFVHKKGTSSEEIIDYVGGLQYYSQLGGVLLAFMPPDETKATDFESKMAEFATLISTSLNL